MPIRQLVQPQPDKVEHTTVEAVAPSAPPPPSASPSATATGFRGKIIDAVTRQPVKEFDVQLMHGQRNVFSTEALITKHFKSATGRFSWTDAPKDTWRAAVTAPGYQQFNVDDVTISPDKPTREIVMPLLRGFAVRGRVIELSTVQEWPTPGSVFGPRTLRTSSAGAEQASRQTMALSHSTAFPVAMSCSASAQTTTRIAT